MMEETHKIAIARFHGPKSREPKRRWVTWERLAQLLTSHKERDEKEGELWSPTLYPEGLTRKKEHVTELTCYVVDIDGGDDPAAFEARWGRWEYVIASTHSHTPELPKWRATFPLKTPVAAADWPATWAKLTKALTDFKNDPKCKNADRIYYLPSCPPDGERFSWRHAGEWLDPAEFAELDASEIPADVPEVEESTPAPAPKRKGLISFEEPKNYQHDAGDERPPLGLLVDEALKRSATGRNDAGMWLACQCRDNNYSKGDGEGALLEYASRVHQKAGDRYTEEEALASLNSAFSRAARGAWEKREPNVRKAPDRTNNLPCHAELLNIRSEVEIPFARRYEVLHAVTGHYLRKSPRPEQSEVERQIYSINRERCEPPLDKAEVLDLVERAYASGVSGTYCEIIQAANLCPVLQVGEYCSIFKAREEKTEEIREALAEDPLALTLTPLYVLRTTPVQYTATVQGQKLELSPQELSNFRNFKLRCMEELSFIPEIPYIKGVSGKGVAQGVVWDYIVNEALKSAVELPPPPEDASPRGIVWARVVEFCTGRLKRCLDPVDREAVRRRLAILDRVKGVDYYMFRGVDLQEELAAKRCNELTMAKVWRLVRDKGGQNGVIALPSLDRKERVWMIPATVIGEAPSASDEGLPAEGELEEPPFANFPGVK
jgi:hypothetical protein